jgi:predicted phosphatase
MQVIKNDKILPVDIDETLISYVANERGDFTTDYGDEVVHLKAKRMNIALLKHHKTVRGYYVLVWSANGKEWAQKIIMALGLQQYVDIVMTKPHKYLDDKPVQEWLFDRIDLKDELHG